MSGLPEFVYLVTVDSEWPVSAIADDHPTVAEHVEHEVERRLKSGNVSRREQVRVWRVRVTDAVEMELMPPAAVRPSLRVRLP